MEFNTSKCCKQIICTECFLQLKSGSDPPCPFCGKENFLVAYVSNSNVSPQTDSKSNSTVDLQTADSSGKLSGLDANIPPPPPNNSLSYLTPEQDKKLRSTSFDHTGTPVASRADREALEAEIRRQRIQASDYEFLLDRSARSIQRSASLPSHSIVSPNRLAPSSNENGYGHRRNNTPRLATDPARGQLLHRSSSDTGSPNRRSIPSNGGEPMNTQTLPILPPSPYLSAQFQQVDEANMNHFFHDEDAHLLMALQSILSAESSSPAMPSLEQLEEMMFMEAIRQSMSATSTNNLSDTTPTPTNAAGVTHHLNTDDEPVARSVNVPSEAIEPTAPSAERTQSNRVLEEIERALSSSPLSRHPPP
jgi:hypothetical protein